MQRVLIVEDEVLLSELYGEYLRQKGFEIVTASEAAEAAELIRGNNFDAVVCDVVMPGRSGFDLFREVQLFQPDLPFIFITGYENEPVVMKKLAELQRPWLAKPLKLEELLDLVKRVIASPA